MNEQESRIIHDWINDYRNGREIKILNVGSGDESYYKVSQPNIWNNLMLPLIESGCKIVNLDKLKGNGIDITCNLIDIPDCDKSYDVIIFASVIEHLSLDDFDMVLYTLKRLLKDDGIIIFSAPGCYPKHDKYDNEIRIQSIDEIRQIFNALDWVCYDYLTTDKIPAKPFYKEFKDLTWMSMCKIAKNTESVTVVCALWRRHKNIMQIIKGVHDSTHHAKLMFWDNSGSNMFSYADYVICSTYNFQSMVKNVMTTLVDTEYVLFQDDDLQLHPDTIKVMLECCKRHPDSIISLKYGIIDNDGVYTGSSYSNIEQPVDINVGRVMLMRTRLAGAVFNPEYYDINKIGEEDICLSLAVQMHTNKPGYVVPIQLCKHIELDCQGARNGRSYHFANRSKTIAMFKELGWHSRLSEAD